MEAQKYRFRFTESYLVFQIRTLIRSINLKNLFHTLSEHYQKISTFDITNSNRKKTHEKWLDGKGRIIRETFFGTFSSGEESHHRYENELLVESTYILEEDITKDVCNYDSESKIISKQTIVEDELFQDTLFTYNPNVVIQESVEDGKRTTVSVETTTDRLKRTEVFKEDLFIELANSKTEAKSAN